MIYHIDKVLSNDDIDKNVTRNEMEGMVDSFFATDPDILVDHEYEEVHSIMSNTNQLWNQSAVLSNALKSCNVATKSKSNINNTTTLPSQTEFESLIRTMIENICLRDSTQIMAYLVLLKDVKFTLFFPQFGCF